MAAGSDSVTTLHKLDAGALLALLRHEPDVLISKVVALEPQRRVRLATDCGQGSLPEGVSGTGWAAVLRGMNELLILADRYVEVMACARN